MHPHQACCCFHSRSRTGHTIPECTRSLSYTTHPCRTWPSATTNSNTHQQHNNSWNCQQHNQTTKITSNGDEKLLVIRWQNAMILQNLLPTLPQKPRQSSIQISYCQHISTRHAILCPHEQPPHYLAKSYEAKHLLRVCWKPWGSLLHEIPITKHWWFPHPVDSPKLSSYQVLGHSGIQQRHTTCYNHPRIEAQ